MNYQNIYKKSKFFLATPILICCLIWLSDIAYSKYKEYRFEQNQVVQRDVLLDVAMKASGIISSNNPSPLFYKTLNRVIVRAPNNSVSGYIYSNNILRLKLASSINLYEISRLFHYLPYEKKEDYFEIKV